MEYCTKCGLLPQSPEPIKRCPTRCCKPKKCCKRCCNELRTFVVPASLGDDVSGEYAATQGLFENMVVSYEANGAKYIYDANGAYTKL